MKHHCEDKALTFLITYKKRTPQNKFASDIKFAIVAKSDFPIFSPEVYCICNFIFPTLYDNRNLVQSILGSEWRTNNTIEEIIELIPAFCERVLENNTNKYLAYYGDYTIDEVYDINYFLSNNELNFFKCVQFLKSKSPNNINKVKKERYLILTDIYFLLFDPAPNYRNMAKLLFWGDIRQISITRTENYQELEKAYTYILDWKNDNNSIISLEIIFANSLVNGNFVFNPIQDFIDAVDRKSNKLKENFRVFQEDYFKPNDVLIKSSNSFDNLNSLIKYNENKFTLYKNSFLANNLIMVYKKMFVYYKRFSDSNANAYETKIQNMLTNKDYDNKTIDNYDVKYNVRNNFGLSRSYSNTFHEDFI